MRFRDRFHAGRALAAALEQRLGDTDAAVVLALPRGGLPVAWEVARALRAPLDVLIVRELRVPDRDERRMGWVVSPGVVLADESELAALDVGPAAIAKAADPIRAEIAARLAGWHGERPPADVAGRAIVLVADGIERSAALIAAMEALRRERAREIVIAAPVVAPRARRALEQAGAEVISVEDPSPFHAIGMHYDDFGPVGDETIRALLGHETEQGSPGLTKKALRLQVDGHALHGAHTVPGEAHGLVVMPGRTEATRQVAESLHRAGFATVQIDLLDPDELLEDERTRRLRHDVDKLAGRLVGVLDRVWRGRPVACVASGTYAAAVLVAATRRPRTVRAIVSCAGRPDLAAPQLGEVTAPTLLLVPAHEQELVQLHRETLDRFDGDVSLEIQPEATYGPAVVAWVQRHLLAGAETGVRGERTISP